VELPKPQRSIESNNSFTGAWGAYSSGRAPGDLFVDHSAPNALHTARRVAEPDPRRTEIEDLISNQRTALQDSIQDQLGTQMDKMG
jgi:hypothetical protein